MGERRNRYNKILKKHFGYPQLKEEQFKIIDRIVHTQADTMAILATGFGKSICFQLPFLITGKCVIVISPLIALMADQKDRLEKLNIPVCVMNSQNNDKTNDWKRIQYGEYKIIYAAPEYIVNCENYIKHLVEADALCCFAIDESHCVSTWSDKSFREDYGKLGLLRDWAPNIPILALTATASPKVQVDIIKSLRLKKYKKIQSGFDRPNLKLTIMQKTTAAYLKSELLPILSPYKKESMIIYTKKRADTETLAEKIRSWGISALAYHAKLSDAVKNDAQTKFMSGEIKCIVATIAFGMGVDNPHVRLVVHYGCPSDVESYYQEIGRAGRDGLPSECFLLHSNQDFIVSRHHIKEIEDKDIKEYRTEQLVKMERFVHLSECRRKMILQHFGEEYSEKSCNYCDYCLGVNKMADVTKDAILLLSVIKDLQPGKFGSTIIVGIIRGSEAKNISGAMKKIKGYGKGHHNSEQWWKSLIKKMVANDYLEEEPIQGKFSGSMLSISNNGSDWYKAVITKTGHEAILL